MRKTIVAAIAAFAVASGAMAIQASAADLDFMPPPAPPPPLAPTWQGFYVGGHLGFGEGTADFRQDLDIIVNRLDNTVNDFNTFRSYTHPDGLIGGVQGGYNFQAGPLVFGIEGDVSFADWGQSVVVFDSEFDTVDGLLITEEAFGTASAEIDMLASVRGRLGYAFQSVLIYGTGGVAWADASARAFMAFDDVIGGVARERDFSGKANLDAFGFVVGGGMGWMVIPQTFSVGIEGLYYFFDEKKTLINETIPILGAEADLRATAELHNAWVLRARADFHF